MNDICKRLVPERAIGELPLNHARSDQGARVRRVWSLTSAAPLGRCGQQRTARAQPIVGGTLSNRATPTQLDEHQTVGYRKCDEPRSAAGAGAGKQFQRHRRSLALTFKTASRGAKLAS